MSGKDLYEMHRRNILAQGQTAPKWQMLTEEMRNVWRCTAADIRRLCS